MKAVVAHGAADFRLEDVPEPEVIVVCCGGGGLLSGIAAYVKLSGKDNCRLYGVEPDGCESMLLGFSCY